ncbi:multiple epidermal growth factor-like domains protein 10 [Saccostrea cucullata]|uniref:multiple epidermal growth factor-like domains protein 10 n=1 Tax=Saccostrea cuccullata TaxID=36930 RepID=UPI002ED4F0E9
MADSGWVRQHRAHLILTIGGLQTKQLMDSFKEQMRILAVLLKAIMGFNQHAVDRHAGFSVYVFNETSYVPPSSGGYKVFTLPSNTCPNQTMTVQVNRVTMGVALFNSNQPNLKRRCPNYEESFASIEICEVHVMVCKEGFYGGDCEEACEKCMTGTICNNITGFNTISFLVCKRGFYGQQCGKTCGTCKKGTYCNNITGICPDGCEIYSTGEKCDVCKDGFYGKSCAIPCGKCKTGTYCDNITGICNDSCQENWAGEKCDECQRYKYGPNCAFDCGHCKNGQPCSKQNGTCLNGCEAGWSGLFCLKVSSSAENLNTDEGISKTSSIIIAIVSTLLVIVLICLGIKIVKKRRTKEKAKAVTETVTSTTVENPQFYDQISGTEMDHVYQEISPTFKKDDYQDSHRYLNTEIVNESKY